MPMDDQEGFAAEDQTITDGDGNESVETPAPINVHPETWPPPNQPSNEPTEPAPPKQTPGAAR